MSLLQAWKKQVVQSPVVRLMRIYWKVFYNEEHITTGYRWERLVFLEKVLRKKLPKKTVSFKNLDLVCPEKRNV